MPTCWAFNLSNEPSWTLGAWIRSWFVPSSCAAWVRFTYTQRCLWNCTIATWTWSACRHCWSSSVVSSPTNNILGSGPSFANTGYTVSTQISQYSQQTQQQEPALPSHHVDGRKTPNSTAPYYYSFVPSDHPSVGEMLSTSYDQLLHNCISDTERLMQTVILSLRQVVMEGYGGILPLINTALPIPNHL